jgi:hypothetical protein
MARKRMFHLAGMLEDETIGELSNRQYRLFAGVNLIADDYGRFRTAAKYLKRMIFSYQEVATAEIEADLQHLASQKLILLYQHQGEWYGFVTHWFEEQAISNPTPSKLPPVPQDVLQFLKNCGIPVRYSQKTTKSHSGSSQSSQDMSPVMSQGQYSKTELRAVESSGGQSSSAADDDDLTPDLDLFTSKRTEGDRWTLDDGDDALWLDEQVFDIYHRLTGRNYDEASDQEALKAMQATRFSSRAICHLMRIVYMRAKGKAIIHLSYFSSSIVEVNDKCAAAVAQGRGLWTGAADHDKWRMQVNVVRKSLREWDTRAA